MIRATTRPTLGLVGRLFAPLTITVLVAACGGSGAATNPPVTSAPATVAPATAAPATDAPATQAPPASQAAGGLTLELASASVGSFVTGEDGMSLYMFVPDEGDASACNGDCAGFWPPLTVDAIGDVTAGAGVTGELGTITRNDGSLQVTLGGNPLYYYANDSAAGDITGQGNNDVWFLAAPDGSGIGEPS